MKLIIQVISYESGQSVKELDCTGKTERQVQTIENGMNRNLDHERFYTIIKKEEIE